MRIQEGRLGQRYRVEQRLPDFGVHSPAVPVLLGADDVGHFG